MLQIKATTADLWKYGFYDRLVNTNMPTVVTADRDSPLTFIDILDVYCCCKFFATDSRDVPLGTRTTKYVVLDM